MSTTFEKKHANQIARKTSHYNRLFSNLPIPPKATTMQPLDQWWNKMISLPDVLTYDINMTIKSSQTSKQAKKKKIPQNCTIISCQLVHIIIPPSRSEMSIKSSNQHFCSWCIYTVTAIVSLSETWFHSNFNFPFFEVKDATELKISIFDCKNSCSFLFFLLQIKLLCITHQTLQLAGNSCMSMTEHNTHWGSSRHWRQAEKELQYLHVKTPLVRRRSR